MESGGQLGFLEGVPVDLEVELGRRTITLGELVELKTGSVINLPRTAGGPLDLSVGGALVGRAEVLSRGRIRKVQVTEVGDVE